MTNTKRTTQGQNRPPVREETLSVYSCLMLDVWPSPDVATAFGIATSEHFGALRHAVFYGGWEMTVEELDEAAFYGPALTALIAEDNPYHGVNFVTPWDYIMVPITSWASLDDDAISLGHVFATPFVLALVTRQEILEVFKAWRGKHSTQADAKFEQLDEYTSSVELEPGLKIYVKTSPEEGTTMVLTEDEVRFY